MLVYDAVIEKMICGESLIHVKNLRSKLANLDKKGEGDRVTGYEKQFNVSSLYQLHVHVALYIHIHVHGIMKYHIAGVHEEQDSCIAINFCGRKFLIKLKKLNR